MERWYAAAGELCQITASWSLGRRLGGLHAGQCWSVCRFPIVEMDTNVRGYDACVLYRSGGKWFVFSKHWNVGVQYVVGGHLLETRRRTDDMLAAAISSASRSWKVRSMPGGSTTAETDRNG